MDFAPLLPHPYTSYNKYFWSLSMSKNLVGILTVNMLVVFYRRIGIRITCHRPRAVM